MRAKSKRNFILLLALIAVVGFVNNALLGFGIYDATKWLPAITGILLGLALMIEGGIKKVKSYFKGGLTGAEITHIVTAGTGFVVAVGSALMLFGMSIASLQGVFGFANLLAAVMVVIELFVE